MPLLFFKISGYTFDLSRFFENNDLRKWQLELT